MTDYPTYGSATVTIRATPAAVYAFLTDLDRLPTISPENQRCEFLDGHERFEVGARFRGHNAVGTYEWHADCEVTVASPEREVAWEVPPDFEHTTTWRYVIEPVDGAVRVTESFDAPLLAMPDVYPGRLEGRCENLTKGCETTLANLKAALEG